MKRHLPPDLRGLTEPPADVLRQLRELDATAELVSPAPGIWWLGRCTNQPERKRRGARMVERHRRLSYDGFRFDPRRAMLALLLAAGFAFVAEYRTLDGTVVADFRERLWRWKHAMKERTDLLQRQATGVERAERADAHARANTGLAIEAFDYATKRPVSIIKPTPKEVGTFGGST